MAGRFIFLKIQFNDLFCALCARPIFLLQKFQAHYDTCMVDGRTSSPIRSVRHVWWWTLNLSVVFLTDLSVCQDYLLSLLNIVMSLYLWAEKYHATKILMIRNLFELISAFFKVFFSYQSRWSTGNWLCMCKTRHILCRRLFLRVLNLNCGEVSQSDIENGHGTMSTNNFIAIARCEVPSFHTQTRLVAESETTCFIWMKIFSSILCCLFNK